MYRLLATHPSVLGHVSLGDVHFHSMESTLPWRVLWWRLCLGPKDVNIGPMVLMSLLTYTYTHEINPNMAVFPRRLCRVTVWDSAVARSVQFPREIRPQSLVLVLDRECIPMRKLILNYMMCSGMRPALK
jgi:hypothetical protein